MTKEDDVKVSRPIIETKKWNFYPPHIACADLSNPLSLAVCGTTVKELEFTSRGAWTRSNLLPYASTGPPKTNSPPSTTSPSLPTSMLINISDSDEERDEKANLSAEENFSADNMEVVSCMIKTNRITRILKRHDRSAVAALGKSTKSKVIEEEEGAIDEDDDEEEDDEDEEEETEITPHLDSMNPLLADSESKGSLTPESSSTPTSTEIGGKKSEDLDSDSEDMDEHMSVGLSMGAPNLSAWTNRFHLFSQFDEGCALDESGWYEVTPEAYALKIAEKINGAILLEREEDLNKRQMESRKRRTAPDASNSASKKKARVSGGETNDECTTVSTQDESADTPSIDFSEPREQNSRKVLGASCGVGGDTIGLARVLDVPIVAVDINPEKIRRCRQNARVYKVESKIEFVCDDINEYAKRRKLEVVEVTETRDVDMSLGKDDKVWTQPVTTVFKKRPFSWCVLSPPWGGREYRKKYCYNLACQKFCDLSRMVQSCMTIADNICLILPRNQDIEEIIHLGSHCSPDGERFVHVEIDRMTERADGYPRLVAVYLCRSTHLLISGKDCSSKKQFKLAKLQESTTKILSSTQPKLRFVREAFPELTVSQKMMEKKREGSAQLSLHAIYNLVFCSFLLNFLEEPAYQIRLVEAHLDLMGVAKFLSAIEDCFRVIRAGGMRKRSQAVDLRSKGGVFFEIIKQRAPEVSRVIRKWQKKCMECLHPSKAPSSGKRKLAEESEIDQVNANGG